MILRRAVLTFLVLAGLSTPAGAVDTVLTQSQLLILFADNQATGAIVPGDVRDLIVSIPSLVPNFTSTAAGLAPPSGGGTVNFLRADGIWAAPPGGGGGSGTVTQINTGTGLSGGPITGSGTILFANVANNSLLANIAGSSAPPIPNTLTAIIDAAIGNAQGSILMRNSTAWVALPPGTSGQVLQTGGAGANDSWATLAGSGTVTSVGLSDGSTTPLFNITNSPVSTSGTLTFTLKTQSANCVVAGPSSGAAAQPGCRTMVSADLPSSPTFSGTATFNGIALYNAGIVDHGCTITSGATYNADSGSVCSGTDHFLCMATAAAVAVVLPSAPTKWREYVVKDCSGTAGTAGKNITVSAGTDQFDGQPNFVIAANFGAFAFTYDGTQYRVH